ncbi:MAG: hypothetical protein HY231_25560 [Acidobacteria bacterium]|nr:hypothetical protein [Acidobacteriota bacterium]
MKVFSLLLIFFTLILVNCSRSQNGIPKSLEEYLRSNGAQEIQKEIEFTNPSVPGKKYIALVVTYNFSSSDGKPQKEHLGFILKNEDQEWKQERSTIYTLNEQKAKDLLAGALK